MKRTSSPFIILSILVLTSCSTVSFDRVELDSQRAEKIKSMAITHGPELKEIRVTYDFVPLQMGALNELANQIRLERKEDKVNKQLLEATGGFDFSLYLQNQLQESFENAGIKVNKLKLQRKKDDFDYLHILPEVSEDAILDCYILALGFLGETESSPLLSSVTLQVRLYDSKEKIILYQDSFSYGYDNEMEDLNYLGRNDQYTYENYDDLLSNANTAQEGIKDAIDHTAKAVALAILGQ